MGRSRVMQRGLPRERHRPQMLKNHLPDIAYAEKPGMPVNRLPKQTVDPQFGHMRRVLIQDADEHAVLCHAAGLFDPFFRIGDKFQGQKKDRVVKGIVMKRQVLGVPPVKIDAVAKVFPGDSQHARGRVDSREIDPLAQIGLQALPRAAPDIEQTFPHQRPHQRRHQAGFQLERPAVVFIGKPSLVIFRIIGVKYISHTPL